MKGAALFQRHRAVPVVRAETPERALGAARACIRGGLPMVEIGFTVPHAERAIAELAGKRGVVVGAGSVIRGEQARIAIEAGARFVVSPATCEEVVRVCRRGHVTVVQGALTPTEVLRARDLGADVVKVFPAAAVGGPAYIRMLREPLPDIPLMATGGVGLGDIAAYLRAGAVAVGLGGSVVDPGAVRQGKWGVIASRARQTAAILRRL